MRSPSSFVTELIERMTGGSQLEQGGGGQVSQSAGTDSVIIAVGKEHAEFDLHNRWIT